ncbi:MAG: translocation/assembly module TamB domain-containing protein [Nostocaceae cyanobacterium]|nr:translocation/assembly module TamB domain-containing protein [Nostocaceae cyanobacterium]
MIDSSHSENPSQTCNRKRMCLRVLSRAGIALGGVCLIGLGVGAWRLQNFVNNELAPFAEQNLTSTLNRPVKLGQVKNFSLTGLRFGVSAIPPTPTDPDRVAMDAVDVGFNIWQLIWQRQLKLDVTLINPHVYIEQDQQGEWVSTRLKPPGEGGAIKTDLDILRIRNGNLVLVPYNRGKEVDHKDKVEKGDKGKGGDVSVKSRSNKVAFSRLNGSAKLLENNQRIRFDVVGKPGSGGNISIWGDAQLPSLAANLQIRTQDLLAADVTKLIELPIELNSGRVKGNLKVELIPKEQPLLFGDVAVQGVQLQIPQAPQAFNNSQGRLSFQGMEVKLHNVATNYGTIPLVANGTIDREAGYKLAAKIKSVSVANVQKSLNLQLPLAVTGEVKADVQVKGEIEKPILLGNVATIKPARVDKVDLSRVTGKFEFPLAAAMIAIKDIQAQAKVGGEITGGGKIDLGQKPNINFNFQAKNANGDAIAQVYNSAPGIKIGTVAATGRLFGSPDNVRTVVKWQAPQATYPGSGEVTVLPNNTVTFRNVTLAVAGGKVQAGGSWNNQNWQATTQVAGVQLEPFVDKSQLENVSLQGAEFNGRLKISGSSAPFGVTKIDSQQGGIKIAGGTVAVNNVQLRDKNFSAQLVANSVRLGRILKDSHSVLNNPLTGTFQISGNTENVTPKTLQGTGNARLSVGGGTAVVSNIQLAKGLYQAQLRTNKVPVQMLTELPLQFHGNVTGNFQVAGSVDSFALQDIQARGEAKMNLADGTATATNLTLANGQYQALVNATGLTANRFNQELRGKLSGKVQVAGVVKDSFSIADVNAAGVVKLSQGIAIVEQPLTATIDWNGEKLTVNQAIARDVKANGYILVDSKAEVPEITAINLNADAKNYSLQQLNLSVPSAIALTGKVDYNGRITGKPEAPNLQGEVTLKNLQVDQFKFEPILTGNITSVQGQGVNLDLQGNRDQIVLNLDENNLPQSFEVKWQQAKASGQPQGDYLAVNLNKLPLGVFNFALPPKTRLGEGSLKGELGGNFLIDQKTWATSGTIDIANPELGRIKGKQIKATFNYDNGQITIPSSEFTKGESKYSFVNGTIIQTPTIPQLKGTVNIEKGKIEDILTTLQLFEIQDFQQGIAAPTYGKANDLKTQGVGTPNESLLEQLQLLYQMKALLKQQQQQRRDATLIPKLADLKGTFGGYIQVDTTTPTGIFAKFDLKGQNWVWGREEKQDQKDQKEKEIVYHADDVILEGQFADNVLQLLPLRIVSKEQQNESNESKHKVIAFTGNIGGEKQSGKLEVTNFPLERLNKFVPLPVGFTGNLNVTAALAGSIDNPKTRGEINITEGTINEKQIQSANAGFNYANGRFNFGSKVIISGGEPVTIEGNIPYQLPFASIQPESNNIKLDVNVKNEGLALLNLFTNQVAFENGEGEVNLEVSGTLKQPQVKGQATINGATFSAQALTDNLTDVTGIAYFDFDRIQVENLQGNYSKGKIKAQGEIPIFKQVPINQPLRVTLDKLSLNLKGLYQGGARGNLEITGSVLNPIVGGKIDLSNGRVLLSQTANGNQPPQQQTFSSPFTDPSTSPTEDSALLFNNLKLVLDKNLEIINAPILEFQATGMLTLNGSLNQPRPEGEIRLKKGGVNLFTTQFNLVRGYNNRAIFTPKEGLNPYLDIRLFAKVLDVIQSSDFSRPEATGLAALETIRVEANVLGPADKLNENLELTSSPARTQTEIVALLGGGFAPSQPGGDSTLGLINIAGSAVLGNFQKAFNQLGNAFGFSELRVFPTVISEGSRAGRSTSSLELAAEAGIDVSSKFSFSSIKILTTNDPVQWGVNYRINDQFRFRASTNLSDDSRAVIEFRRRF